MLFLSIIRSSPSTAITWSDIGCDTSSSSKVSSHISAVAAAAKAAATSGRHPHLSAYGQKQRASQMASRRNKGNSNIKYVILYLI